MFSKIKFGFISGIVCLLIGLLSCCSSNHSNSEPGVRGSKLKKENAFEITAPKRLEIVRADENFVILINPLKKITPDSVIASLNGRKLKLEKIDNLSYTCFSATNRVGQRNIDLIVYYSDSLSENILLTILVLAKEAPKTLSYKLIRSFKHDEEAYTQGLLYNKGYLYESTGQPNRSSLRCIDPKSGEIIRKRKLEPQYFGEGIALIGKEIYMLTYKEHKGFVFNLSDFELLREFDLQTEEGWGLTTDGKNLIQSDGSAYLYSYSPEFFSLNDQFEVCNNERLVNELNELEYTAEGIYANIYGQNSIVLIDPAKGIVTHTLDLSALFP
jgi:glutaminyl-peptide cyclotransferase